MNEYGRIVKLSVIQDCHFNDWRRGGQLTASDYCTVVFYEYSRGIWVEVASYEFKTNTDISTTHMQPVSTRERL